ncbi:MAG: DUF6512 family protein [Oscillibacter sp.]|jgi:hypothetical protein|nr:DUF6512 family protein [Oscillibacter sp.]
MRKQTFRWGLWGFLFTLAAGTALHFSWDWCGRSRLAASVMAVNESVWEHMKMLFIPAFVFSIAQWAVSGRGRPGFSAVRGVSVLLGTLFIPVAYYTYTGALGIHATWVDVLIFVLAAALMWGADLAWTERGAMTRPWQQVMGFIILWALLFAFVWCTYRPPHLPLWQDPVTQLYGIP